MNQKEIINKLAELFSNDKRKLFLVGGAVRDSLMGKEPHELDFTTDAKPEQIKQLLKKSNPNSIYSIGEKFGTIGAIFNSLKVEITTFRSETYNPGDRHPEVKFGQTLEADLSRRDFTINAIAYNPTNDKYIDPFDGMNDIKNKIIRVVDDSADRFREDPLRILRAIRFAVVLNFSLEENTKRYIVEVAPDIASISAERISQELDKILTSKNPSSGIELLVSTGLINYTLPEVIALKEVNHEANQHKNIYQHTLTVLENVPDTKIQRWLALLHDIAKPQTKSVENNEVHFLMHENVGAKIAKNILTRLHYDNKFINDVTKLIKMHLRVNLYLPSWTDGAVRRLMLESGDLLDELITFSYADITSARQYKVDQGHKRINEFKIRVEKIKAQEELSKLKSPLSGDELMELFQKPAGPWIKEIKDSLLNMVIDGKLKQEDKETAKKISFQLLKK